MIAGVVDAPVMKVRPAFLAFLRVRFKPCKRSLGCQRDRYNEHRRSEYLAQHCTEVVLVSTGSVNDHSGLHIIHGLAKGSFYRYISSGASAFDGAAAAYISFLTASNACNRRLSALASTTAA